MISDNFDDFDHQYYDKKSFLNIQIIKIKVKI